MDGTSTYVTRDKYPGVTLHERAYRCVHYVEWQPGNGTRYELIVVELTGFEIAGSESEGDIVCIIWRNAGAANSGHAVTLPRRLLTEWHYLAEKMECLPGDALAILAGVRRVLGEGD